MKRTHLLFGGALLLGAALVARAALDGEPAELGPLGPGDGASAVELSDGPGLAAGEVEPLTRALSTTPSVRTPVEAAATEQDPQVPVEVAPTRVEILVVRKDSAGEDVPVPGVGIVATRHTSTSLQDGVLLGTTDALGRLVAELPDPGLSLFQADPETLPPGVGSALGRRSMRLFGSDPSRDALAFATEETLKITLELPSVGTLVVTVLEESGVPAPHVLVEVWSNVVSEPDTDRRRWMKRGPVTTTDASGTAVLENVVAGELSVRLPAQAGRLVAGGDAEEGPMRMAKLPAASAPKHVHLAPAAREHVGFVIRPGPNALRGRVVDEAGMPLAGIAVGAHYDRRSPGASVPQRAQRLRPPAHANTTVTDDAGWFLIEGIEAGPYLLYFDLDSLMALPGGRMLLPAPSFVREVPASARPQALQELGDVVVPRPELFLVKGRVILTAELVGGEELVLMRLRPRIGGKLPTSRARCDFDPRTGEFEVACRLPLERLTLRVGPSLAEEEDLLRSGRFLRPEDRNSGVGNNNVREYEFVPAAGVTLENVELHYP